MQGKIISLFVAGLLLSTHVYSGTVNQSLNYSNHKISERSNSLLSNTENKPWEVWTLTEEDWTKYKKLMQGPRGNWSPNLDPLTVLGVEANSEDERQVYARKLAMIEFNRTEKELAFQRSYDRAMNSLYPMGRMIDVSKLPKYKKSIKPNLVNISSLNKQKDRLIFFTKTVKCSDCRSTEQVLINDWLYQGGAVDVYVTDAKNDNDIRQWAKRSGIKPKWVKSKQVTLNYDKGGLFKASGGTGSAPWVVVRRNEYYVSVQ